jgi:hypothetical protein
MNSIQLYENNINMDKSLNVASEKKSKDVIDNELQIWINNINNKSKNKNDLELNKRNESNNDNKINEKDDNKNLNKDIQKSNDDNEDEISKIYFDNKDNNDVEDVVLCEMINITNPKIQTIKKNIKKKRERTDEEIFWGTSNKHLRGCPCCD